MTELIDISGSQLEKSEQELRESLIQARESFYRTGVILMRIKKAKEYKPWWNNFDKYLDDHQPCGIKRSYGWELIKAVDIRDCLPDLRAPGENEEPAWTPQSIRPLTHKDFTKSDVRRIGKKIATAVRNGEPFSSSLVKRIADEDRGVPRKKLEKKRQTIAEADTPAQALQQINVQIRLYLDSLGAVPDDFWESAETDDPGCTARLAKVVSELASFLKS